MRDRREIGSWVPSVGTADHILFDQLVLGRVERFDEDGPCYAWLGDRRIGAFKTDLSAREAIMEQAFAAAIERYMDRNNPDRIAQAEENESLVLGGPDALLKAKACIALINSAIMLRQI